MQPDHFPGRRSFLLGLGAAATSVAVRSATPAQALPDPTRKPDTVMAFAEASANAIELTPSGDRWQANDIEVTTETGKPIFVSAPRTRLTRIRLRWHGVFPDGWRFLGDHWERSYGDLEWRGLAGERLMPWYFLASNGRLMHGYGVKTGARSICCWQADAGGITLWLDVSNGGSGVELGDRRLEAATIVIHQGDPRAFCRKMCDKPRLAAQPIYGSNNWYYAYGEHTSSSASMKDAELMAELMPAHAENRPYVVLDMGWGAGAEGAGPVAHTTRDYPDMPDVARRMKGLGVRPGIWVRPTLTTEKRAEAWRLPAAGGRPKGDLIAMDPSIPEALAYMAEGVGMIRDWGYQLIKHDFSTFDLTGRWGFEMGPDLTPAGWHFHDRGKTTAEVVLDLYRALRHAAGDAVLLGCDTIGHLSAGLVEAQRIGDDTSGRDFARTRKMGVNTLAFRMAQHNTFFAADADCVPVTAEVPWSLTRQWLDLVARSGTALFVSADPAAVKPEQKPALKAALAEAARAHEPGVPLDWMDTTLPQRWRLDGKPVRFDWYVED
jgi:alpha-galactosidase